MPHPIDVQVGKRIRAFRRNMEQTQTDLALVVGVKFQQIQKYETGANRVSASRLWDIAQAQGKNISDYFGQDPGFTNTASLMMAERINRLPEYECELMCGYLDMVERLAKKESPS